MAIIMARTLIEAQCHVIVFNLDAGISVKHGIPTTEDLEWFVQQCDAIVIGGGNLLARSENWYPGVFMSMIEQFVVWCEQYGKKVHAVSIGGDGGVTLPSEMPVEVTRLLGSKCLVSCLVRLPSDEETVSRFGVPVRYVPDILWSAAEQLNINRTDNPDALIGVHLPLDEATELGVYIDRRSRQNWEPHRVLIDVFLDRAISTDFLIDRQRPGYRNEVNRDPVELLRFLGTCDTVISHKLHLGLAAMSMGVPFVSFRGHPKVGAQLTDLGWRWRYQGWPAPSTDAGERWFGIKTAYLLKRLSHPNYRTRLHSELAGLELKSVQTQSLDNHEYLRQLAAETKTSSEAR